MGLARSTYYYRLKHEPQAKLREIQDVQTRDLIDRVHIDFPVYGYRKLHEELKRRGYFINEKKIRRIQGKFGLFATQVRKWIKTTDSKHKLKKYPNLISSAMKITDLNQVWVSDITYVRLLAGFIFVAIVLDLCSRKVVGWAISKRINAQLAIEALRMAVEARKPDSGCIHHSDQGVQYCSEDYIELLTEWRFQISMSRKGNPYGRVECWRGGGTGSRLAVSAVSSFVPVYRYPSFPFPAPSHQTVQADFPHTAFFEIFMLSLLPAPHDSLAA